MNKKLISFFSVIAILASSYSISYADAVEYSKYKYTEAANDSNYVLNELKEDLKDETKEYRAALRIQQTVSELTFEEIDDNYDDRTSRYRAAEVKFYDPIVEGKEYFDKSIETKKAEQNTLLEAEKNYFTLLTSKNNLENRISSFNLMKTKYDTKVLEKELGKISALDFMAVEKAFNDSYVAQLTAQNAYEESKNTFNKFIFEDINTPVTLQVQDIPLPSVDMADFNATLTEMLNNSYQLKTLILEKERLEAERTLKGRYSGFGNTKIELEALATNLEDTIQKIDETKLELDYQLRTNYNNTLIAQNKFKSAELSLKMAESNYKISTIKSDNNMISDIEFIESKQAYDDAWNAYQLEKLNAFEAVTTFNNFIELNTLVVPMNLK